MEKPLIIWLAKSIPCMSLINASADQPLNEASRTRIKGWVKGLIEQTLPTFRAARVAAQQVVDTPDDVKRPAFTCTRGI